MKNFTLDETVRALRPMIERADFVEREKPASGKGRRPAYSDLGDMARFENEDRALILASDRGEVMLTLVEADGSTDRIDLECPKRNTSIAGGAALPIFTASTMRCLRRKLARWL
jgi:hypothetical protein